MDYKIVEKSAFKVVGKGIRVTTKDSENLKRIPKFWDECCNNGVYDKICSIRLNSEYLITINHKEDKQYALQRSKGNSISP